MNPLRFSAAKVIFHTEPTNQYLNLNQKDKLRVLGEMKLISEMLKQEPYRSQVAAMEDGVTIEFYPHSVNQMQLLPGGPPPQIATQKAEISLGTLTDQGAIALQTDPVVEERHLGWLALFNQLQSLPTFVEKVLSSAQTLSDMKRFKP